MTTTDPTHPGRMPWSTWLLTLAQALNLTAAVIAVTIAALVGTKLAATPALGTVPYGIQFAAVMLFTYPASMLMRRYGRRTIFSAGALFLVAAGMVGYVAVSKENFILLIVAHALLGVYISCANFYRFADMDNMP